MRQPTLSRILVAIISTTTVTMVGACGSVEEGKYPTKSYTAEISNPSSLPITNDLRVAVVWGTRTSTGNTYQASQDIALGISGVGSFTIDLFQAPPAAVLMKSNMLNEEFPDDGTMLGIGTPVVYEDKNGNGKLDMIATGATAPVDAIVGADARLLIFYVDGQAVPTWLNSLQGLDGQLDVGFNLVNVPKLCLGSDCEKVNSKIYSPGDTFSLPLIADPRLNEIMCIESKGSTGSGKVENMGTQTPAAYPTPANATCNPNGHSYSETTCVELNTGLCEGSHSECTTRTWDISDSLNPPSGWPCEINN